MNRIFTQLGLLAVTGACFSGCGLPRDPEGTLSRVRGGQLRVGLVEGAPWVVRQHGEPAGVEVQLVRRFAQKLHATPVWVWGSEQQHMEALEKYQLDLVAGGLTSETPWNGRVGVSSPYMEERILVGAPASLASPSSLKGHKVAAPQGEAIAALLEKQGATPIPVSDPAHTSDLVAAPQWQLEAWRLKPTSFELETQQHVFALPPGENGWLVQFDQFLQLQHPEVQRLLQQEASTTESDKPQQERSHTGGDSK